MAHHYTTRAGREKGDILMRKQLRKTALYQTRRRRFLLRALVGVMVPAILFMVAGVSLVLPHVLSSHAADGKHRHRHHHHKQQQQQQAISCTLTVPANPLSAQGLAT